MTQDKIVEHEDIFAIPYLAFVNDTLRRHGRPPAPTYDSTKGKVKAYINHGRWVVECPSDICKGAMVVTSAEPYFLCPSCGNSENNGYWYGVQFPGPRTRIEAVLMKRPAANPWEAFARNWSPGETLTDLRRENREHGIS